MDSIHNQGLRLALGAFRTSPVNSLYAEANKPSLNLLGKKFSSQYYLKLKPNHDNPTHKVVFEPLYKDEFLKREKVIPPFSLRCEVDINCLDCDLEDVANFKTFEVPLWTSKCPTYLYNLASDKKAITDPIVFQNKFLEVKEQYYTHEEIYPGGSKDGEKVASAAILDGELHQFRLPNNSSIFSAELRAVNLALNHIEQGAYWRYIIFTDSLSAMQALEGDCHDMTLAVKVALNPNTTNQLEGEKTDNPLIVSLCERADIVFLLAPQPYWYKW